MKRVIAGTLDGVAAVVWVTLGLAVMGFCGLCKAGAEKLRGMK